MRAGLDRIGLALDEDRLRRLIRYGSMVLEYGRRVNLTAARDMGDMVYKHLIDSASPLLLDEWPSGARVLDVGSGAGLPGMVLKICRPDLRVTLLDARRKRARALEDIAAKLGVEARVRWGRAEEVAREAGMREGFDVVIARAVARLDVLLELCVPFVAPGGRFIAMKGPGVRGEEMRLGEAARGRLGCGRPRERSLQLPAGAGERVLLVFPKVKATPPDYPRPAGVPEKRPLGEGG